MVASAPRADRREVEAAAAIHPGIFVANDRLCRESSGLDAHSRLLADRRSHREYFNQARSQLDDISLDADHLLRAERRGLAIDAVENLFARIVDQGGQIAQFAAH